MKHTVKLDQNNTNFPENGTPFSTLGIKSITISKCKLNECQVIVMPVSTDRLINGVQLTEQEEPYNLNISNMDFLLFIVEPNNKNTINYTASFEIEIQ